MLYNILHNDVFQCDNHEGWQALGPASHVGGRANTKCAKFTWGMLKIVVYIYIIRLFGIESEAPGPQVDEVPSGTLGSLKHDR